MKDSNMTEQDVMILVCTSLFLLGFYAGYRLKKPNIYITIRK